MENEACKVLRARAIVGHVALEKSRAARIFALNLHDNAESTRADRIERRRRDSRQGRRERVGREDDVHRDVSRKRLGARDAYAFDAGIYMNNAREGCFLSQQPSSSLLHGATAMNLTCTNAAHFHLSLPPLCPFLVHLFFILVPVCFFTGT